MLTGKKKRRSFRSVAIIKDLRSGMKQIEVAKKHNVTRQYVGLLFKEEGFKYETRTSIVAKLIARNFYWICGEINLYNNNWYKKLGISRTEWLNYRDNNPGVLPKMKKPYLNNYNKIRELKQSGLINSEIARLEKCSIHTVYRALKKKDNIKKDIDNIIMLSKELAND